MYENDEIINDVIEVNNSVNPNAKIDELIVKLKNMKQ
jgi:hypothetical protein